MGSHSDGDSPLPPKALSELSGAARARGIREHVESLERRAIAMSERGENLITAGRDGEAVLGEWRRRGILIRRMPDDPDKVLRISIGAPEWAGNQAYLVFRGDPSKVRDLLRRAEKALRFPFLLGEDEASDGD